VPRVATAQVPVAGTDEVAVVAQSRQASLQEGIRILVSSMADSAQRCRDPVDSSREHLLGWHCY
jgi:hypothetical protein